jgi:hypothetical protein
MDEEMNQNTTVSNDKDSNRDMSDTVYGESTASDDTSSIQPRAVKRLLLEKEAWLNTPCNKIIGTFYWDKIWENQIQFDTHTSETQGLIDRWCATINSDHSQYGIHQLDCRRCSITIDEAINTLQVTKFCPGETWKLVMTLETDKPRLIDEAEASLISEKTPRRVNFRETRYPRYD